MGAMPRWIAAPYLADSCAPPVAGNLGTEQRGLVWFPAPTRHTVPELTRLGWRFRDSPAECLRV